MNLLIYILVIINFLWSIYVFYLLYTRKSFSKINQTIPSSSLKISVTRFNPFNDLGGDQSFILAILDQNNTGAIITSLHNRDITRIYAKSIKEGEGDNITLSKEEKSAIVKTIKS
ncbi:hypothetical protein SDC9_104776 [bioreactor metagenome]|uniref:DUF4446 domain-containing protein n=1 Tax=bioreactor metagenome TaxID=1076179 RepID=A0A645AXR0_9ZZZZ